MDIRRLQFFLRIADEGSMSRAARVIGIAQPALSRQMRLLEEALGVVLFTRTSRGMELTEHGEQLRGAMVGPLRQLELAMQNVGSPFAQLEGGLVLGLPETTACVLARPLLSRLAAVFPKVKLGVVNRETVQLVEGMLKSEIDIALIHGPAPDDRLFAFELLAEDLVLVGGPACSLSADHPVPFDKLVDFPLVLPRVQPGVRSVVERTALTLNVKIEIRLEVDSLQISKDLIESGLAYGVLPVSAVRREHEAGRLRYAPICDPVISQRLVFAVRPHLVMPRAFVVELGSVVQREIARLVDSGAWPATLSFERPSDTYE